MTSKQTEPRLDQVRRACEEVKAAGHLAGLVASVVYGHDPPSTIILGSDEHGIPLAQDTLFPVASITKLAVALGILRLADMGRLSISDRLGQYVPAAAAARDGVTLQQLLTHTAGLPALGSTHNEYLSWPVLRQACLACSPVTQPGTRVSYVNTGYGLLGVVLERVLGVTVGEAIDELVSRPLGIEAYLGVEPPRLPAVIFDPTDQNAGTSIDGWNSPFSHSLGEPWSGLVTTPDGAFCLFRAFLGIPAGFLRPETQVAAIQDQTGGLGGGYGSQTWDHCPWGLGPALIGENMNHWMLPGANAGTLFGVGSSGCAGFADPSVGVVWSIQGTRTMSDPWFASGIPKISTAVLASAV